MKPSIYWLFVFVPITVILEHTGKVPPPVIFFSAASAIVPIAVLIVRSTEQMRGPATPWAVCSTPPSAMRLS